MFDQLTDRFETLLRNLRGLGKITDANIQDSTREIRRVLLEADVHYRVARDFVERVRERAQGTRVIKSIKPGEHFIKIIHDEMVTLLGRDSTPLQWAEKPPTVILLAGLQGSGKTTIAAKLAGYLARQGQAVLLVAADVYRPAAIEQLQILGRHLDIPVFERGQGDPVSICREGLDQGRREKRDVVILDTAGRLHVDQDMMTEIQAIAGAVHPHEILFVADGMLGQDAVKSARAFSESLDLTGTILTKLDGDARGGAALSIVEVTGKPIRFIGTSEKMEGLEVFDPRRIVDRILGFGDVISLVEKAQQNLDQKEAQRLQKKLSDQTFDLDDFKSQLGQLQKLGQMEQLLKLIPGVNRQMLKNLRVDDRQLVWVEAIINSMTPEERRNPELINGGRRLRMAKGAGRPVQEVNQLLKQFMQMQKMMKKMSKMKIPAQRFGKNPWGIN